MEEIKLNNQLSKLLNNPFYSNVQLLVQLNLKNDLTTTPTYRTYTNTTLQPEIIITCAIDTNQTVLLNTKTNKSYLENGVTKWEKEAKERGEKYNIKAIRAEVLSDINGAEINAFLYNRFINTSIIDLETKICNYIEAVLAIQKIAQYIWEEGKLPESVWHSKHTDFAKWPQYIHIYPAVAGFLDGIIDEIKGIPLAIFGLYDMITNEEVKQSLIDKFSSQHYQNLYNGLIEDNAQKYSDSDKTKHFLGQSSVIATSMLKGNDSFL